MAAEFLLNLRWHLGRVTHPYGLENTPEALARASAELAFHLGLAKRSQGMAHLTTLTSADLRPEAFSLADPAAGGDALAEGAGGNVFVLAAQVDHMRSRSALRPRQEEPVEMFTALIAGFQDGDGDDDEAEAAGESDGSSEATFCFLSSGNSSALAARVIDWFERRFDCYVEAFDAVPVATLGLLATRWSVLQPPGNPLDPERTLVLTLAPPAESVVRSIDAITVLVPLAAVFAAILDRRHAQTHARRASRAARTAPARRAGSGAYDSVMEDADALLLNERVPGSSSSSSGAGPGTQEQEQEQEREPEPDLMAWGSQSRDGAGGDGEDDDDEGDWDALDLVDELCGDMLGLDVHKMTLAEFKTPLVALSSDGFLEIRDLSVVLQVLEDLAGELLLPLTNSSIT